MRRSPNSAPAGALPTARIGFFSQDSLRRIALFTFGIVLVAAGCGRKHVAVIVPPTPTPAPVPGIYVEQGIASWYGNPFNGRRASNGEIYDMNQPVAAHRTLPFGSIVRVTNLKNGLTTDVRIIDRGPFVNGRIIDLSFAAARMINMVGDGIAPVRLDLISAPGSLAGYFAVQVGAFQQRENAERVRDQLLPQYPVAIQDFDAPNGHFYRVRVGRESSEPAAQALASKLASENHFQTFVVRLDDVAATK